MLPETMMDIVLELATEIGYTDTELADQSTNNRLINYIKRGEQRLNEIAGAEIDYDSDLVARGLLVNYGIYANSQVSEHFEPNYHKELASLNANYSVKAHLTGGGGNDEE